MTPAQLPPIFQYATQFNHWLQQHQLEAYVGLGVIAAGALALKSLRRGRERQGLTSHGSAAWGTARDVRRAGLSRVHGVVVGVHDKAVWLDDAETHVLLLGPTGSGKDTFFINPTLHWGWSQSTLNLDCQNGQMYDATRQAREQLGRVEAFVPYRSPLACINVLHAIRVGQPEEFRDARLIGHSLTAPEAIRRESSAGVHFRELAAITITAASLHLCYASSTPSLAGVWQFLTQQGSFTESLKTMRHTPHTRWGVHQAVAQMSQMLANIGNGDELSSAWSTTLRPLMLYLDPQVAASTDTSTINLDDLQYGTTPMSLYLLAESASALADMYQVYRVILDTIFAVLMRHKAETFPYRLLFVGNELPRYGYMRAINDNAAVQRKYGIKGFYIAQDLKQLEDVYGEQPELWINTRVKLFMAPANDKTAERISKNFLGDTTVEYLVESHQGKGRRSVTPHRTSRKLMTTDEVGGLDNDKLIACITGAKHPFLFEKYGFDRRYVAA